MFVNEELQTHLETSSVIRSQSTVIAEWNMNIANNIQQVGNYRFRPTDTSSPYYRLASSFSLFDDPEDSVSPGPNYYTNATDADVILDGGYTDNNVPLAFVSKKQKTQMLYSLEECFGRFRPRSGINKLTWFPSGRYTHHSNENLSRRPRYYMADKTDNFKYWSSFRTEGGTERGVAISIKNGQYYIDDAAPYVTYNSPVPANRVVVKMQTHVGDIDFGDFTNLDDDFSDPFYGFENQKTPVRWKIQYLENNTWSDAMSFNPDSTRRDGSPIIGSDGYVEISYGLIVPEEYRSLFYPSGEYASVRSLPEASSIAEGTAYLVGKTSTSPGKYYVAINSVVSGTNEYESFNPKFGWQLEEPEVGQLTNYVTDLTSPQGFANAKTGKMEYTEFKYIQGLRVVVETMNVFESTFDLIELSPRLAVDMSSKTSSFSITKTASDLGISGMPVGQLLASTGTLNIFDYDQAFFMENTNSIIKDYLSQNIQFKFYEAIVGVSGYDYYVPIKTMYSEGFPEISSKERSATLQLRDMFFYLESITAPQVLIKDASVSYAISLLLDYAGFSNYVFKRNPGESEMIIPYFSVGPDKSIAEILSEIAVSAQTAMFFDEYNNFIVMSKNYIMPTADERATDMVLYGSKDFANTGVRDNEYSNTTVEEKTGKKKLANIIDIAAKENHVYNDGTINYVSSYIQKSYSSIQQASFVDRDKTWIYKPSLLWEASSINNTKSINNELNKQSGYVLGAIPLNTSISNAIPVVESGQLKNNVIDLGDGIYWITRYNGYFYANGEIIRYDAVEYSIPGLSETDSTLSNADGDNIWITSAQEYQRYFSKVPFNGKIYPTGRIRIYSEPEYVTDSNSGATALKSGPVSKHGRGQFGTPVVQHNAGLNETWTSDEYVRGVTMNNNYLFSTNLYKTLSDVYSETINRGPVEIDSSSPFKIQSKMLKHTVDSIDKLKIVSPKHGQRVNDTLYVTTTGMLPPTLSEDRVYYVKTVLNEDEFTISETSGGTEILYSTGQMGVQSWVPFIPTTPTTATLTVNALPDYDILTKTDHLLEVGDRIYFTSTSNGLNANQIYYVAVANHDTDTFSILLHENDYYPMEISGSTGNTLSFVKVFNPAIISCTNHRFLAGDQVKFATTGELPIGVDASTIYYVTSTGLTSSTFTISTSLNGDKVVVFNTQYTESGTNSLLANITAQEAKSKLILPSMTDIKIGMTVKINSGTGKLADGTVITAIDLDRKSVTISPAATSELLLGQIDDATGEIIVNVVDIIDQISTVAGKAGIDQAQNARSTTRNGIIKNFLANTSITDGQANKFTSTQTGTIQSSALVLNGALANSSDQQPAFLSYVYKPLEERFKHFGTRMRIIGKIENKDYRGQSPYGSSTYYVAQSKTSDTPTSIGGSSGGLAVLLNPLTNNGYYFEIMALTEDSLTRYENGNSIHNLVFYKLKRDAGATSDTTAAVPIKLWGGNANVIVDSGTLAGQHRMSAEDNPTVYDLAVEYKIVGSTIKFYLYINDVLAAVVEDTEPTMVTEEFSVRSFSISNGVGTIVTNTNHRLLSNEDVYVSGTGIAALDGKHRVTAVSNNTITFAATSSDVSSTTAADASIAGVTGVAIYNNMALFTRGASRLMFENVYALTENIASNAGSSLGLDTVFNSAFGTNEITATNAFKKYSLSGMIQSTYLSGISSSDAPKYNIYYDEFGTILREVDYQKIRYDKAYPSLYSKIAPTFNNLKGYSISGFRSGAYGAEFLVFNTTDKAINLDSTSGNYLRILGVAFTQQSESELTVDQYFSRVSDLSNPEFTGNGTVKSPYKEQKKFTDIKYSRMTHGKKEFSLSSPYIQTKDAAEDLMEWTISRIMKPRRSVGVNVFALPTLQLGDIIEIDYTNDNGIDEISLQGSRFVVYGIQYNRDQSGPSMQVFLSEV